MLLLFCYRLYIFLLIRFHFNLKYDSKNFIYQAIFSQTMHNKTTLNVFIVTKKKKIPMLTEKRETGNINE